jgi:N-hydroxyarylamine O-acetyltransferase
MSLDLAAYLRRIGHTAPLAPTLDSARAIVRAHAAAIPFENLDPLLARPVRLDLPSLEAKLVAGGRGGYCFEQNSLLREVLLAVGFRVTSLAARVLWNQPDDAITARGHMLLRLEHDDLDGPHIADVGFGGQVLTGVLRLEADTEQATPHEPFRFLQRGEQYTLQSLIGGAWKTLYRFDQQEQYPVDYEVTSYYLSTNPMSHFTTSLIAARAAPDRRYALRNRQLAIHHLGGDTERRLIDSPAELREVLTRDFGIRVPDLPALDAAFARLA